MGEDGVHRTDIDIVRRAGLDGVLEEGPQTEKHILDALDVLDAMDELIHRTLALGELHLSVLGPELIIAHLGISLGDFLGRPSEEFLRDGVEGILVHAGSTCTREATHKAEQLEFCGHIVLGEHPLAIRQLVILLQNTDIIDEIDIRLLGDGHLTTTHMERGVLQDIQVATETHVVLVVRQEMQVETRVAINLDGVLDIITVETDALFGDGGYERILQQTDMVLIEVDIGEDILQNGVDDIARLEQVVDTLRGLTGDDGLLGVGITAVDLLRHRLVDTDG